VKVEIRALVPALWKDLERLFGVRGACGGCWCMYWRHPLGERWDDVKGGENRQRFRTLVLAGKAHGMIAYVDNSPVGWIAFDKRRDYARLDRSPSLACEDADCVWSLPCFFVRNGLRRRGISSALLAAALKELRRRGAGIVEAYPARPATAGKPIPAAFAFTGTQSLFRKQGFAAVGRRDAGKQRMRLEL
jgi:GNAT superfamily N-acetyltransferase